MPYDSKDSPQEEVKKEVTYAEGRGLKLLLGYDVNSHIGWGNMYMNPRGESLHDFSILI